MRNKPIKLGALAACLAAAGLIWLTALNAQENKNGIGRTPLTTNWLGSIVVGKPDSIDGMTQQPYPQCEGQYQLGLRSDGVVIWRTVPGAVVLQSR